MSSKSGIPVSVSSGFNVGSVGSPGNLIAGTVSGIETLSRLIPLDSKIIVSGSSLTLVDRINTFFPSTLMLFPDLIFLIRD